MSDLDMTSEERDEIIAILVKRYPTMGPEIIMQLQDTFEWNIELLRLRVRAFSKAMRTIFLGSKE